MSGLMFRRFRDNNRGTAAIELALVLPMFVLLILGSLGAASLGFSVASMNYAVEEAARCAAVNKTLCSTPVSTVLYAQAHYSGPSISPVFAYTTSGCGNTVTATATYSFNLVPQFTNVPLSVSACRPSA